MNKRIQSNATRLAKLSFAALLSGASIASAQDAHTTVEGVPAEVSAEAAPVAEPVVSAPIAAPMPAPVAEPVASIPAAPVESAPAPKPSSEVGVVNLGGTKISLYGFVQANAVYEDGKHDGTNNWTEIVPENAEYGEGRFMFNVNQTRIGFNLAGPQKEGEPEVSGKFESDFASTQDRSSGFRIRHAYGQVKFKDIGLTLLMGQTSDLVSPLSAPTLNQGGLRTQGCFGTRRPMLRLSEAIGPVEVAVAATDDPDASSPIMPGWQGSIKAKVPASWAGEKQNVEFILSGHYATAENAADDDAGIKMKDSTENGKKWGTPASWSGVASLSLPIINILSLSGEMFYGQNLKSYNRGSINKNGGTAGFGGEDTGVQSLGGWGAVNVKLLAGLALAAGMGVENMDKDRKIAKEADNNMVVFGNLKYNLSETMFIGFEYASLSTEYDREGKDKEGKLNGKIAAGNMNRFELVLNYAFK
jgi:hypothetical protein